MNEWLAIFGQTTTETEGLTIGGIVVMVVSIGLVLGLMLFCIARILGQKSPSEYHHAPLDIDTHDQDT